MKLRVEDNVMVIKGRDRGKQGRVTQIFHKEDKVMVEGMNIVSRHTKATGGVRQAGIIQKELPEDVIQRVSCLNDIFDMMRDKMAAA